MGRYYNGDIEGKFWFGVQSSDDAEFFGVSGSQNYLNYYFTTDDLPSIKSGIKKCEKALGKYKEKLDKFFKNCNGYNDEMLVEKLSVDEKRVRELLTWYARLGLGEKILKCVKKNGECNFDAEL